MYSKLSDTPWHVGYAKKGKMIQDLKHFLNVYEDSKYAI